MQSERAAWAERLPENPEHFFPWLLAQEQTTVLQLLTVVVAVTVTGICGSEPERHSNDALALAVGLDMRNWWTATGPTYFNHVSKGRILDVVTEAVDANAARLAGRAQEGRRGDGSRTDPGWHGLAAFLSAHSYCRSRVAWSGDGRERGSQRVRFSSNDKWESGFDLTAAVRLNF